GEQLTVLEHEAEVLAAQAGATAVAERCQVGAVEVDRTGAGLQDPGEHVQQGGLAAAGGAHDGQGGGAGDVRVHAIQGAGGGALLAVGLDQATGTEERCDRDVGAASGCGGCRCGGGCRRGGGGGGAEHALRFAPPPPGAVRPEDRYR